MSPLSRIARCALVAVALITVAAPAHATDKRAASAAFQRGRALYDAGQYADALASFNAGYESYPLPGFLVNIGQCQRKLDKLDEAVASFQQFLAGESSDDRLRAEVREALDEIAAERQRRADAAETAARRQRDEAEARHPAVADEDARPDLRVRAAPGIAIAPAATVELAADKPRKSRRWVWAIVGVLAAGAVASAITVGVLETRQPPPRPGTLGLLDGRN